MSNLLSEAKQKELCVAFANNPNKTAIGREYGVSPRTVGRILKKWGADVKPTQTEEPKAEPIKQQIEDWVPEDGYDDELDGQDPDEVSDEVEDTEAEIQTEEETPTQNEEVTFSYVLTNDSLSITRFSSLENEPTIVTATKGSENFNKVFELVLQGIQSGTETNVVLAEAYEILDKKFMLEKQSFGKVTVDPLAGVVYVDDTENNTKVKMSSNLTDRIIDMVTHGKSPTNLVRFSERLAKNPSFRAVNELYEFLIAKNIEIDEDGMVVCFKKVRYNYTDVHTGTFDNSVGNVVRVARNQVDEDSTQTCSYGLHVCSKAYLGSFGGARVLKVLVDPADFVAIPKDYYSYNGTDVKAKARVCGYKVVEDVTDTI